MTLLRRSWISNINRKIDMKDSTIALSFMTLLYLLDIFKSLKEKWFHTSKSYFDFFITIFFTLFFQLRHLITISYNHHGDRIYFKSESSSRYFEFSIVDVRLFMVL